MKIRALIYCLVVILLAVLSACNGRANAVKSVYATAYTILTQTAIAVAKIPT
ncbi:MAG: hypothetical protein H6Q37_1590, partial [Chloroflexi bacterium]|nr:hypothetical protein [Chloroflexota bacterium]